MNAKLAQHILENYVHLLTPKEAAAELHHRTILELSNHNQTEVHYKDRKSLRDRGILSKDLEVLTMLSQGYDHFRRTVAQRILNEHPGIVDLTACSNCGHLMSTTGNEIRCEDCLSREATNVSMLKSVRYA
jgi:hypothetical protein